MEFSVVKNIMNMEIVKQIMKMEIFKFTWKYKFTIFLTIIAFNIFILALFIIYRMKLNKKVEAYTENDNYTYLIMFHVDWCPYCKTAKPVWDKITKGYNDVTINNKKLKVISLDATDENSVVPEFNKTVQEVLKQFTKDNSTYKIDAYPTIVLSNSNNNIIAEFEKNTTYENIEQFINNNI